MAFKQFAKRAFWVAVFVAPVFWLLFTAEGQRYGDVLFLKVFGNGPEMRINFPELRPDVSEAQLRTVWPDLELECSDQPTAFGDRLCTAPIAAFNGNPARYVALFLYQDQLNAMKIGYQRSYHRQIVQHFRQVLGDPSSESGAGTYQWATSGGLVVLSAETPENDEPAFMWLAAGQ